MVVIAVCCVLVVAGLVVVVRWGGDEPDGAPRLARRLGLTLATGVVAGVLAAGAGGRLVMRLLAVTSPESTAGLTEGLATIGEISAGGTLGLFIFAGVPAGLLCAVLYLLAGSLLPRGRWGGAALGLLLFVLVGTRLEPMRADNIDFNLLGPDWLSVLAFTALAVFQGLVTRAVAARLGLPPLRVRGRAPAIIAAVVVLAALPGFAIALTDILAG